MPRPPVAWRLGVDPIDDESLISFIFRLAERRREPTAHAIWAACGFEWLTNQPRPEWLAALSQNAQVGVEKLEGISFGPPDRSHGVFRGRKLPAAVFKSVGAYRFICPECLAEAAYQRALWHLTMISACPVHRCRLVVACDACGELLTWHGNSLTRCRCVTRRDLTLMGAPPISEEEAAGTAAVHGLLGDRRFEAEAGRVRAMAPFRDLDDAEIVDFLFRFGAEIHGKRSRFFSHERLGDLAFEGYMALTMGLRAVAGWPDSFERALATVDARGYPPVGWSHAMLRWLDGLPCGHGDTIRDAVIERKRRGLGD